MITIHHFSGLSVNVHRAFLNQFPEDSVRFYSLATWGRHDREHAPYGQKLIAEDILPSLGTTAQNKNRAGAGMPLRGER